MKTNNRIGNQKSRDLIMIDLKKLKELGLTESQAEEMAGSILACATDGAMRAINEEGRYISDISAELKIIQSGLTTVRVSLVNEDLIVKIQRLKEAIERLDNFRLTMQTVSSELAKSRK